MYEILKDLQVLFGGMFAVVAATIGFLGVRYAQNKTLENSEHERKHREEMQESQIEQHLRTNRKTLISALLGELSVVSERLDNIRRKMAYFKKMHEESGAERSSIPGERIFVTLHAPIYEAYIDKLGLLPPSLSFSVAKVYSLIKTFSTTPNYREEIPTEALIAAYAATLNIVDQTRNESRDAVLRLHAVRLGHNDPGIGMGEDFWKDQGDPEQF